MRKIIIVIFLLSELYCFSQNNNSSSEKLSRYKIFLKKSIENKKKSIDYKKIKDKLEVNKYKLPIKIGRVENLVDYNENYQFYNKVCKSILILGFLYQNDSINSTASFTSAFVISKEGICITSYNSIFNNYESCKNVYALDFKNNIYFFENILYANKNENLVIFKLKKEKAFYPLKLARKSKVGEKVFIVGHPRNLFYNFSEGIISQKVKFNQDMILTSASFAEGAYGSPLLNEKGEVIAMCSSNKPIYYNNTPNSSFQMFVNICLPAKKILNKIRYIK